MVMLSNFLRFHITDQHGIQTKFTDLAVSLLTEDYPPVTRLFFLNKEKERRSLPWETVQVIDWGSQRIKVADLQATHPASSERVQGDVLLAEDVLDALVLDLQNRRVTRANDLWLEGEKGRLLLRSADTSSEAILRRLTRGVYRRVSKSKFHDWKYVEFLRGDPHGVKSGAGYQMRISRLPSAEIASLTSQVPYLHAAELLTLLPDPKAADTLEAMTAERQLQVFEELDEDQAVRLLALMAPDVATDLIGRLETATMRRYVERLPKGKSDRIIELLRYPEDSVGGIMTNDVVFVPGDLHVEEARFELGERLKEPDFVYLIYIVDTHDSRRLRGVISLRDLITANDRQRLDDIMDPYVDTLHPLEMASEAAYRVINSHLAAMPVVGDRGQLVGIVTVDAAVSQVAPRTWRSQAPRVFS